MRALLAAMLAACLATGVTGGLMRAGVDLQPLVSWRWAGAAIANHAFLMVCAFLGTVVAIERAVALRRRLAFVAPLLSAGAGLATLAGQPDAGAWLSVLAAIVFIAANVAIVRRQPAPHTALLLAGACAWLAGNLLHALGTAAEAAIALWFAFLILTIAAERLEMTRLLPRRAGATPSLVCLVAGILAGAALSAVAPGPAGATFGLSIAGLAFWLLRHDIARRTIATKGLSRFMAASLLLGYLWLAVGGAAWCATAAGVPLRDVALHALGLGFVFSMIFAHAPVILPAVARVKLLYGAWFWLPLAVLHGSLLVRFLGARLEPALLAAGASTNAVAIGLFLLTAAGAAVAWRRRRR
ncbi:MAG: hypothetical protein AB7P21_08655 [Lautropia sp.]